MVLFACQIAITAGALPAAAQSADPNTQTDTSSSAAVPPTGVTDPNANDSQTDDGSQPADDQSVAADPNADPNLAADSAALEDLRRQNIRETPVDVYSRRKLPDTSDTPGIPLGSFVLRPALTQSLGFERTTTGNATATRSFLQTGLKGSLTSDWSKNQLIINGEGTWQKTLSGTSSDNPEGKVNAALRLDISRETIANLKAGFSVSREDVTDANAINNATSQATVNETTASAEIVHDYGILRGTTGIDFTRDTYGAATLANGKQVSQTDLNRSQAVARARLGYELSPALIPFIEASYGRIIYDNFKDSLGFRRDTTTYAAKAGISADFGDKLKGELAGGYMIADFEDARLASLSAMTIDGNALWSPQRGTLVSIDLRTDLEPTTTAGSGGAVAYTADAALTQDILEGLSGRLTAATTWRDYVDSTTSQQMVYSAGAGLTWAVSRSIDATADISYEKTLQKGVPTSGVMTGMLGLTLKR